MIMDKKNVTLKRKASLRVKSSDVVAENAAAVVAPISGASYPNLIDSDISSIEECEGDEFAVSLSFGMCDIVVKGTDADGYSVKVNTVVGDTTYGRTGRQKRANRLDAILAACDLAASRTYESIERGEKIADARAFVNEIKGGARSLVSFGALMDMINRDYSDEISRLSVRGVKRLTAADVLYNADLGVMYILRSETPAQIAKPLNEDLGEKVYQIDGKNVYKRAYAFDAVANVDTRVNRIISSATSLYKFAAVEGFADSSIFA